jgi:hypothetical protein
MARIFGSLLCGVLLLVGTAASAIQGDPLPGIDVSMEQNPGGIIIATTTTNGTGEFLFASVVPGNYRIVLRKVAAKHDSAARASNNFNNAKSGIAVSVLVAGRPAQATTHAAGKVKDGMVVGTITLTAASAVKGIIKEGLPTTKTATPNATPSAR